jgi:DHA2 family multidrug resistance protein-like MFS transporter
MTPTKIPLPAILAVQMGVAIVTLDISLTSTALPAIAIGIDASPASTIWIINVYYLAVVAALLPLAALGEIYGHRRVFFGGLIAFAIGSLAAGLSNSLLTLALARAVLGAGTAAVSATTPALIRTLYPPSRLGHGLGVYALVVGVAFSVGPTAASAILSVSTWRWLFLMNIPFALVTLLFAKRDLPQTPRNFRRFDGLSALFCAGMFAGLMFGIAGIAHRASWPPIVLGLILSAGCGYGLRRREAEHAAPILAIDLFRIPLFALSSATSICAFAIQGLIFVVLPFLFQFKFGYSQIVAGYLITPWPVTLAVMTLIAAPLGGPRSARAAGRRGTFSRRDRHRLPGIPVGLAIPGRDCLAPGPVRDRLWIFSNAQHEGDHEQRTDQQKRRRQRHPRGFASVRSVGRRSHRRHLPVILARERHLGCDLVRCCPRRARKRRELPAAASDGPGAGLAAPPHLTANGD